MAWSAECPICGKPLRPGQEICNECEDFFDDPMHDVENEPDNGDVVSRRTDDD